jgi:hypothetical protein
MPAAIGLIGVIVLGLLSPPGQVVAAEPARFSIAIQGGKVDPTQRTIRVTQGTTLELAFTADEPLELHLHGYDQLITVQPGSFAAMRLEAKISGRFGIAAHRFGGGANAGRSPRHVVLLYLEVHPR